MSEAKKHGHSRRNFLLGVVTGAGAVSAMSAALSARPARAKRAGTPPGAAHTGPILYRRTAEAERYYRTLYT